MSLKIGDKVKMTKRRFRFYSNLYNSFDRHSLYGNIDYDSYVQSVTELFAINGVGTVKKLNPEGDPLVRWKYSLNGVYYYHQFYYDKKDVRKLSFLERLILKIKGII